MHCRIVFGLQKCLAWATTVSIDSNFHLFLIFKASIFHHVGQVSVYHHVGHMFADLRYSWSREIVLKAWFSYVFLLLIAVLNDLYDPLICLYLLNWIHSFVWKELKSAESREKSILKRFNDLEFKVRSVWSDLFASFLK